MTHLRAVALLAVWGVVVLLGAPQQVLAAEYTVKLAYVAQPINPFHKAMEFFAQKVAEKSSGRMEVQLFHSSQLGGERDYVEGLQLGSLEMAAVATAVLGSFDKSINLFQLPFLFRSSAHLDHVVDASIGRQVADKFPPLGIRILAFMDFGARYLHNSKRMVRTPADMRGLKFRSMENPISIETYQVLGARAVPMARPEVYSALKQGVLDGLDNDLTFYESMGDYEVAKYTTMGVPIAQTAAALMISEKAFQRLPSELQKAVTQAAIEALPYERKIIREAEEETLKRLKAKGVVAESADSRPFEEAARPLWDKYADQVGGRQMIDAVLATK